MYKIMLVEDEALVRDSMIQNIDWGQYGFELVCACENGREAIEQLAAVLPDVVVTDICMPFVDGLELARHIHENYPSIYVVILTGFNEFSYAQQAVKLRVHDFVLKPISPRDFYAILAKLSEELAARNSRRDDLRTLQSRAQQAEGMLRNALFRQLLRRQMTTGEVQEAAAQAGLTLSSSVYCVLFCQIQRQVLGVSEVQHLVDAAQLIASRFPSCTSAIIEDQYAVLLLGGRTHDEVTGRARDAGHMLTIGAEKACGCPAQVGVSTYCGDPSGLHRCFREAHHALGYCFSLDRRVILDHQARAAERPITSQDPFSVDKDLLKFLQANDFAGALRQLQLLFETLAARGLHRTACIPILERLRFSLSDFVPQELQDAAPQFPPQDAWFLAQELQPYYAQMIAFIERCSRPAVEDPAARCVESAKGYILQHFHDSEFSLSELLSLLNVSKSYFSSVFKAKTGQTFVEYLTSIRMEKAKYLLTNTSLCTYEIAERIGFTDPHYFSVTFKRWAGKTPREYREAGV